MWMVQTILAASLVTLFPLHTLADDSLPVGSHPAALDTPHFPDRLHAFVWRNWLLVEPSRIAEVVGTSTKNIEAIAISMGLPSTGPVQPQMCERGYITIIRRNWHILPYEQLLQLLDMSPEQLAFSLTEDDFLFIKLGSLKPNCEPLRYNEPNPSARMRAAEIKRIVEQNFGNQLLQSAEPRFHFVEQLAQLDKKSMTAAKTMEGSSNGLRFVCSYFGNFGDPLSDSTVNPYPDGLLAKLVEVGVNGVWMHVVLRQLAPGDPHFPEFGDGHERRLENLRRLVKQTKKYGIGVYLYINEPRALPPEFFKQRPEMAGISSRGLVAMCTSDKRVRQWMTEALAHLFREVPDLAGVFTITASENVTNCAFEGKQADCSHCRGRSQAEIVAEVNAAIEQGVHRGNPNARVIAYDWGWNGHGDATDTIALLPKNIELMSISEWGIPIERGGVRSKIDEYSLSAVGPGPKAKRHWALAKQRGLKTVAKVAYNNTWELSAVPFLPVLDLVAEHCENLTEAGVDGSMLSWSLGGYPSPNLQVAHLFATLPDANKQSVLNAIAEQRYGASAVQHVRTAWTAFSDAFRQFPHSRIVLYAAPQQLGPANLLYGEPTGYRATMVGIPYDDVAGWSGPYPPNILGNQFDKVASIWSTGIKRLDQAVKEVPKQKRKTAELDLGIARAAYLHFASVGNQIRFVLARDALCEQDLSSDVNQQLHKEIQQLLDNEIHLATELFTITQNDSRIGFEASNHYYYVPLDLVEKVINCKYLRQEFCD